MSGIYIPGVERPRCCMECHYHKSLRDQCILTHRDQRDLWSRPDWCPIVPVPDHGRLIDADALCRLCDNTIDHSVTPNDIMRMSVIIQADKEATDG